MTRTPASGNANAVMSAHEPRHHTLPVEGATLHAYEWPARTEPAAGTLLFAHATGFHARCWDRVIDALPEYRSLAVDQRGHGKSTGGPPIRWTQFGADLLSVAGALDLRDIVGVGHSMGGHAMTEAAARAPERFQRLVLIDPVITDPKLYERAAHLDRLPGEHPVARRRAHWDTPEEMLAKMRTRAPFDTWDERVLRDYCQHGLLPSPSGHGFVLACDPRMESEVYMTSASNSVIYDHVRGLTLPVLVVRAKGPEAGESLTDFRLSPTWPSLAATFPNGKDLYLPEHTHFLPMENPSRTAEIIRQG